jgi:hypothetical protein
VQALAWQQECLKDSASPRHYLARFLGDIQLLSTELERYGRCRLPNGQSTAEATLCTVDPHSLPGPLLPVDFVLVCQAQARPADHSMDLYSIDTATIPGEAV